MNTALHTNTTLTFNGWQPKLSTTLWYWSCYRVTTTHRTALHTVQIHWSSLCSLTILHDYNKTTSIAVICSLEVKSWSLYITERCYWTMTLLKVFQHHISTVLNPMYNIFQNMNKGMYESLYPSIVRAMANYVHGFLNLGCEWPDHVTGPCVTGPHR